MGAVDLGAAVELAWTDAPADSTPALSVVRPDGSTVAVTVLTLVSPSTYKAMFTPTMAGRHVVRWLATGTTPGAHTDLLDVWPADPRFIISLEDGRQALNAKTATDVQLEDLRLYIAAATPVIEDIVGTVVAGVESFVTSGGRSAVVPPVPTESILSVTLEGAPVSSYFLEYGVLYAGTRAAPSCFGYGDLEVRYAVGSAVIPPNVRLATRELVRHWWQIGKQATGGIRGAGPSDEAFTPSGFAVPRRVIELCTPHEKIGGFA